MTPTESPTTVGIVDQRSTNSSSPSNAVSTGSNHVLQHNKAENVIFVGNLSFFCEEKHLYDLFHQYSHVDHVRILQNSNKTKSLMYGFVTVTGDAEAKELVHMLDNHLFMGRRLK
jgi:RNA recognition motif-containing protein